MNGAHRHSASRRINASSQAIYDAFLDREAISIWLPPDGARMDVAMFEPRIGGQLKMTLTFATATGKSTDKTDVVVGRFVDLVPGKRIVQDFEFASADPAFAGTMRMTWTLETMGADTNVTVTADNVPVGIRQADHETGMNASLAHLAAFVE